MSKLRKTLIAAALALVGMAGFALAQVALTVIPFQTYINTNDAITGACLGVPTNVTCAWSPPMVAGVPGYVNGGALATGFSYTYGHAVTDFFAQPAATLATGTLIAEATPSDGQRECFLTTQTQTALTWSPNSGQTMNNPPTAAAANTPVCMTFQRAAATWYRSP